MVKIKQKVTIRRKVDSEEQKPAVTLKRKVASAPTPEPKQPASRLWLWILLAAAVVAVAILCIRSCGKDEAATPAVATEQVEEPPTPVAEPEVAPEPEAEPEAEAEPMPEPEPEPVLAPAAPATSAAGSVEEEARLVIRGNYGNGQERKDRLGPRYAEIQNHVNYMYRNGLVQ